MSDLKVQTFDNEEIKYLIKNSDPYLQHYIKALKKVSNGWERLFQDAMKKIRENEKNKINQSAMRQCPYRVIERYADNGELSHYELVDSVGNVVWSQSQ